MHAWGYPGYGSEPCTHAFKPFLITRHVAGGFVLLVWCIMQIIVTKYSITVLTFACRAARWLSKHSGDGWLEQAAAACWSSNDTIIWGHLDKQLWLHPGRLRCVWTVEPGRTIYVRAVSAYSFIGFSQSLSASQQCFLLTTDQHQPGLSAQKPTNEQAVSPTRIHKSVQRVQ